ncbi:Thivi_2564 family membrane protein [Novosphingobium acidiphilum]|uniref:Thivi_2564 family membrane protein n=1 Tax=Novosphingobium acidiphilum TaxID=505248 RepID=UPI00042A712C|nr:Thivi_2564 family membrane protein [Novosphingobium acidiphilum]
MDGFSKFLARAPQTGPMSLLNVMITLITVGVILWLVNTLIPMDGKIRSILNWVIVIAVVVWLFKVFDVAPLLTGLHTGH